MNLNIKFVNKKERDWKTHDVIQYTERVPYKKKKHTIQALNVKILIQEDFVPFS